MTHTKPEGKLWVDTFPPPHQKNTVCSVIFTLWSPLDACITGGKWRGNLLNVTCDSPSDTPRTLRMGGGSCTGGGSHLRYGPKIASWTKNRQLNSARSLEARARRESDATSVASEPGHFGEMVSRVADNMGTTMPPRSRSFVYTPHTRSNFFGGF